MNTHRCGWLKLNDPVYVQYHDNEWGKPLYNDKELFELFSLETQAAGLSWLTVLKKREAYKKAFCDFDIDKVITLTHRDIESIINNYNVIKHKKKLEAIVYNAKGIKEIINEYTSWSEYLWSKIDHTQIINHYQNYKDIPTTTTLSDTITKDLKQRGFKFVGSVTIQAFLQAAGLINDHEEHCISKYQSNL